MHSDFCLTYRRAAELESNRQEALGQGLQKVYRVLLGIGNQRIGQVCVAQGAADIVGTCGFDGDFSVNQKHLTVSLFKIKDTVVSVNAEALNVDFDRRKLHASTLFGLAQCRNHCHGVGRGLYVVHANPPEIPLHE